uniref:BPTI/Kunitz inhibitor domain-containing protein n=1 Tax=Plectus sambesii TaxID=2011161 RepID=A0A914V2F1_9BILA
MKTFFILTLLILIVSESVLSQKPACCYQKLNKGYRSTCWGYSLFQWRWYYDCDLDRCCRFCYTGCGGNENNFRTKRECVATCVVT